MTRNLSWLGGGILALAIGFIGAGCASTSATPEGGGVESKVKAHLENFDDLDYNVFTGQKWAELHRSHAHNITVHWPDGHSTQGIEDLKAMFVWDNQEFMKQIGLGK